MGMGTNIANLGWVGAVSARHCIAASGRDWKCL